MTLETQDRPGNEQPRANRLHRVNGKLVNLYRLRPPDSKGMHQDVDVGRTAPDDERDRGTADDEHGTRTGTRHS